MRLRFTRTLHLADKDPEELLVYIITGTFGFYSPLIQKYNGAEISFERIEDLGRKLCPDVSQ
jgi:hypothetical protein